MSKYVLFSPIGASDPVRQDHDGPLLHIVRHYKPHKVYLFFTKEMAKNREAVIKAMGDFNTEIEEIITNIENPHNFDIFAEEFSKILLRIKEENADSEILLNITSGTTPMSSALCLEVVTSHLRLKPIQVITPTRGSNAGVEFGGELENNFDNLMEDGKYIAPNRCIEPDILSFRRSSVKRDIISLVEHFEYRAAAEKLENNKYLFNEDALTLIQYAALRLNDNEEYRNSEWNHEFDYNKDWYAKLACEYYCILDNNAKTGELSYFVLLLKPLAEFIARCYLGDFTDEEVKSVLNNYYKEKNKQSYRPLIHRGEVVYNLEQYICIMGYKKKPEAIIAKFREVNIFLESRNELAHLLYREDGINPKKPLSLIRELLIDVFGNKVKKNSLNLYEKINERIIQLL